MLQNSSSRYYIILMFIVIVPSLLQADDMFKLSRIAYFEILDDDRTLQNNALLDWSQPIIAADGKLTTYQPPLPVLNLLNDPSPENAQAYVLWQQAKMQRILLAQEAVAALHEEDRQ